MVIRRTSLIALPLLAVLTAFLIGNANGSASHVDAQNKPTLALDMDITNGDGPCNPIDDTRGVNVGDTYQIAICLTDAPVPPGPFNIEVLYDDTLDECVPVDCPAGSACMDSNPDVNAGATSWTSPDLGLCDCSSGGQLPPSCDRNPASGPDKGAALINCDCTSPTLPVGSGVSSPMAVLTFKNAGEGSNTFSLGTAALYADDIENIMRCPGTQCFGGTSEDNLSPTSPTPALEGTPAAGTTPGAETTPGGEVATTVPAVATASAATAVAQGTPIAAINQAATATSAAVATKAAISAKTPKATAKPGSTGEEDGGSSGPNPFLIAGIVVVAGIVVGGAGWFGYRRFRATR